jgi:hypothetical protein
MSVFRGGLPTRTGRNKLVEAFKGRKPGDLITHDEVSKVIDTPPKTAHYDAVTGAWRRYMFSNYNLRIVRRGRGRGVGFAVLNSEELTESGAGRFKQMIHSANEGMSDLQVADTSQLSGDTLAKYNLTRRLLSETGAVLQNAKDTLHPKLSAKTSNIRLISTEK